MKTNKQAKANNALERRNERASGNREELLRRGTGRGQKRRRGEGAKGGSIGERNRRGERICRARAIPSKSRRRNELGQRETRNSKKTHYGGLGYSMTNTS